MKLDLAVDRYGFDICDFMNGDGDIEFRFDPSLSTGEGVSAPLKGIAVFHERYPGFPTTDLGPLAKDLEQMEKLARKISLLLQHSQMTAPKSWKDPAGHAIQALRDPWYDAMFQLQSTFFHSAVDFFRKGMGYDYALVPLTTECISSPMGLGSDSLPVKVSLHGTPTYLADSMQFTLEYNLRVSEHMRGTYYISPSFRGEDSDSTHMNQFYHVECELRGELDDGMAVMEKFVIAVARKMLASHSGLIASIAGDTTHIDHLLKRFPEPDTRMPRIRLDDAIELCRDVSDTYEDVLPGFPEKGKKLTRKGDQLLIAKYGGFVWPIEMHHLSVPFYQAYADKQGAKALCADLLMGIGETGGLGQRHRTPEDVRMALRHHEVPEESYQWYMDMRIECPLQTVGWGMGMERFMLWLLRHDDVRDVPIIPRLKDSKYLP